MELGVTKNFVYHTQTLKSLGKTKGRKHLKSDI